jgi:anaerobic ribonucleoside-triphosphate reductase activating protein
MPAKEDLDPKTKGHSKTFSHKPLTAPQMPTLDGFIRLSGPIEHDNIVNGAGLRAVIWTQGCRQHCPGCQNPETWDENAGIVVSIDEVKDILRGFKGQSGVTFCGGEPLLQAKACKEIADWARAELGWNIWSFTGLIYEKIRDAGGPEWEFVKSLDALIDGPYIQAQRDLTMKFRGSRNQRILYLKEGEITRSE